MPIRFPAVIEKIKYIVKYVAQSLSPAVSIAYAYIEKVVLPVPSIIAYTYIAVGKILRATHVFFRLKGLAFSLVLNASRPVGNIISSISISICRGSAVKTVKPYPSFSLVLAASKPTPTVIQSFQTSVEGRVTS